MWGETVMRMIMIIIMMMMMMMMTDVDSIRVEGLSFQHTTYRGLDRGMDWQHAAVVTLNSNGNNVEDTFIISIFHLSRGSVYKLRVLPHGDDGAVRVPELQRVGGEERVHRHRLPRAADPRHHRAHQPHRHQQLLRRCGHHQILGDQCDILIRSQKCPDRKQ